MPKAKPGDKIFNLRMPKGLWADCKKLAVIRDSTMTDLLLNVIGKYVSKKKKNLHDDTINV